MSPDPLLPPPAGEAAAAAAPGGPAVWTDDERAAWAPPEEIDPAAWAERYRELSPRQTSRPGRWRNANQPAAVGLMVLAAHPGVREIWCKKSAQFGASEAVRNVIGQVAHLAPCPVMLVLPDEKTGRRLVNRRILPLFEDTPVLRRLLTGNTRDKKLSSILLANGFELGLAWAGSPASMAADPYRKVFLDEVDKYQGNARQADPVEEARGRTRTFPNSLVFALSTPSDEHGRVTVGYNACGIKLDYYAPCPHCGAAFRPCFDRIVWEKFPELPTAAARADAIQARRAAWLECDACAGTLPPGEPYPADRRILEGHRRGMLNAGWWATADQGWRVYADGRFEGDKPEGAKVGLHVHEVIDLSTPPWETAGKFVACDGNREALKGFYNVCLGLEFREQTTAVTANVFRDRCVPDEVSGFAPAPARTVPTWASRLVMTVDTQKSYFWFVIRAWGHGLRSQRVHHGRAASFEELEDLYYNAHWHYEGDAFPPVRCFGQAPLAIDSGGGMDRGEAEHSITDKVYQWCLKDPTWRYPVKGASKPFEEHVRWRDVTYVPPGEGRSPYSVRLHFLDPVYWRDLLAGYVAATTDAVDPETGEVTGTRHQWLLNDRNDDEYNRHLAEVRKVRVKRGRSFVELYEPKTPGGRHDYHDLEAYQIAWAHGPAHCAQLPSPRQLEQMRAAAQQAAQAPRQTGTRMPDGRAFFVTQRK